MIARSQVFQVTLVAGLLCATLALAQEQGSSNQERGSSNQERGSGNHSEGSIKTDSNAIKAKKQLPNVDVYKEYDRHRSVVYATREDDVKLLCDVFLPKGKGPFPTILMIHGGAWRSGTKLHMKGHAETAAKKGFVAISINYRHAPRYKWPAQIDDCKSAMDWLLKNSEKYKIDKSRIAVWGYSAGGHLATYLAMKPSKQSERAPIRCVVCGGGIVDLTLFPKDFPFLIYFMGATRRQAPDKYKQASPLTHLSKGDPPMFFYHGDKDMVAPLSGVKSLVSKANELGIKCEFMLVPNKEHILTFFDQQSYDKGLEFIEKELAK